MFRNSIIIFGLLLFSQLSVAAIYKWVDAEGTAHFTDSPPENIKTKKVTVKINSYQSVTTIKPKNKKKTTFNRRPVSGNKNVVMYSAQWCGICRKAKRYFKQKGIRYTELDIDKNSTAKRQYKAMRATGVPVIFVDDTRLNGFTIRSFERVYY